MDVTFPLVELTGRERSFDELTKPDERMQRYAGLTVEQLQAPYLTNRGAPSRVHAGQAPRTHCRDAGSGGSRLLRL